MPTTYGNDIVYCLKSHCGVRGYCRQKWVLQVQIICKFSNERTCKRNKDVQGLSCGFEDNEKNFSFLFSLASNISNEFMLHFKSVCRKCQTQSANDKSWIDYEPSSYSRSCSIG